MLALRRCSLRRGCFLRVKIANVQAVCDARCGISVSLS